MARLIVNFRHRILRQWDRPTCCRGRWRWWSSVGWTPRITHTSASSSSLSDKILR